MQGLLASLAMLVYEAGPTGNTCALCQYDMIPPHNKADLHDILSFHVCNLGLVFFDDLSLLSNLLGKIHDDSLAVI